MIFTPLQSAVPATMPASSHVPRCLAIVKTTGITVRFSAGLPPCLVSENPEATAQTVIVARLPPPATAIGVNGSGPGKYLSKSSCHEVETSLRTFADSTWNRRASEKSRWRSLTSRVAAAAQLRSASTGALSSNGESGAAVGVVVGVDVGVVVGVGVVLTEALVVGSSVAFAPVPPQADAVSASAARAATGPVARRRAMPLPDRARLRE